MKNHSKSRRASSKSILQPVPDVPSVKATAVPSKIRAKIPYSDISYEIAGRYKGPQVETWGEVRGPQLAVNFVTTSEGIFLPQTGKEMLTRQGGGIR